MGTLLLSFPGDTIKEFQQKKLSSDIGPDACIGAGCKMAQTLPIFALAKGPLGITLVVAQLAINLDYAHHPDPPCSRQAKIVVPIGWPTSPSEVRGA